MLQSSSGKKLRIVFLSNPKIQRGHFPLQFMSVSVVCGGGKSLFVIILCFLIISQDFVVKICQIVEPVRLILFGRLADSFLIGPNRLFLLPLKIINRRHIFIIVFQIRFHLIIFQGVIIILHSQVQISYLLVEHLPVWEHFQIF